MASRRPKVPATATVIRPLRPAEAGMVGDVLADSHADYPSFAHLFPDPERRRRILRTFFAGAARDAVPFGAVDGAWAGSRMLAIAVWLPPGRFPWSAARKVRATPTFLSVAWRAPTRAPAFFASGANAERAFPDGSHWYLEVLGVRTEAQGQGLGRRLLDAGLARVDASGLAGYLETADHANLAFYERFGFAFDRELQLIPDGPPHWAMHRPPAGRPTDDADPVLRGNDTDEPEVRS